MGIATQNPKLRPVQGQTGIRGPFMTMVAQQLREIMAKLGIATVEQLVGRCDLLEKRPDIPLPRAPR